MSMTREEAREWFENHMPTKIMPVAKTAYKMALSALRPITREQVEKVWEGCDLCRRATKLIGFAYAEGPSEKVQGEKFKVAYVEGFESDSKEEFCQLRFCPACGRPLTKKAVEMVMERLEALKDDSTTD